MTVNMQQRRTKPMDKQDTRLTGKLYVSRLTYRRGKVGTRKNRKRPPAIKWVVLELGLFMETPPAELEEIIAAGQSLIGLADRRGIKCKPSPGSFGSAMLRASSEWKERRAAPEFISKVARDNLPGNFYAINEKTKGVTLDHAYYLDQESSHHKICSSIPLPHPHTLRARGYFRAAEREAFKPWTRDIRDLASHIGLVLARVQVSTVPSGLLHLYPPWAHKRGSSYQWIWTPELRFFEQDHRLQYEHTVCALTSTHMDPALWEYSEWALAERQRPDTAVFKSSLLAAYGMLACRSDRPLSMFTVHGRKKPERATVVELPLLPRVFKSDVLRTKAPAIQNVIARGVIEAETRTRSIEYARALEAEGIPVAQVYADGLLAVTDTMPLFLPEHWRIAAGLTRVFSPHPNSIISNELVRLPGIIGSAQEAYSTAWEPGAVRERLSARPHSL